MVATQAYRASVHTGHARLRAFKRDLLSLGLTDAQIHEIIPRRGQQQRPGKASKQRRWNRPSIGN